MAAITACLSRLLISSSDSFAVLDASTNSTNTDVQVYKIPRKDVTEGEGTKHNSNTSKDGNRILASAFCKSGKYFALADDRKYLHLYSSEECRLLSSRSLVRRCTGIVFTEDDQYIVISDKSGDVYRYLLFDDQPADTKPADQSTNTKPADQSTNIKLDDQSTNTKHEDQSRNVKDETGTSADEAIEDNSSKKQQNKSTTGELLLGHLSMILNVTLIKNDKYVVTCDKDEKIRISCYPNSYNIYSYCLGHTQFVNNIIYSKKDDFLISGSGDCTIRIWDSDGRQKYCQKCQSITQSDIDTDNDSPYIKRVTLNAEHKLLAVCFGKCNNVEIYKILFENKKTSLELIQCLPIEGDVWDIQLDSNGRLWVLQCTSKQYLKVYNQYVDKFIECQEDNILECVNKLNNTEDFFSGSVNVESMYPNLRKMKIDNMTEYLQRKEKRIHGEKLDPPTYNEKKPKLS